MSFTRLVRGWWFALVDSHHCDAFFSNKKHLPFLLLIHGSLKQILLIDSLIDSLSPKTGVRCTQNRGTSVAIIGVRVDVMKQGAMNIHLNENSYHLRVEIGHLC